MRREGRTSRRRAGGGDADEGRAEPHRHLHPKRQAGVRLGLRSDDPFGRLFGGPLRCAADRREPGRLRVLLRRTEQAQTLARRRDRLDLRYLGPLQTLECLMNGYMPVGPPNQPSRFGRGKFAIAQPALEESERLDAVRLLDLVPGDPVLLIELPALARLPDMEADEIAVPQARKFAADVPLRLQADAGPADEALRRVDRLVDAAQALGQSGFDIDQEQVGKIAGPRREPASGPRQGDPVRSAQIGEERPAAAFADAIIETPHLVVASRRAIIE